MSAAWGPTEASERHPRSSDPSVGDDRPGGHPSPGDSGRVLERLERLAWLLDSSIRVPLTRLRVGVDGLIGLVPIVGDLASAGLSLYLIAEARRFGLPKRVLFHMSANMVIDAALGAIPVVGDLFDFGFKANRRNVELLRRFLEGRARSDV